MADQVTINMAAMGPDAAAPLDSADGRKMRNGERDSRDVRHRTNGNHHHQAESDTDDHHNKRHHQHNHRSRRRSRSRSGTRSRTPSPSHSPSRRGRRNVDAGVSHLTLNLFYLVLNGVSFEQETPQTEKDITTATNDVEPLLVNNIPRKNSRK